MATHKGNEGYATEQPSVIPNTKHLEHEEEIKNKERYETNVDGATGKNCLSLDTKPEVLISTIDEQIISLCDVNIQIENSSYPNNEDVDIESYDIDIEDTSSDGYDANQPCVVNQNTKESKVNKCDVNIQIENSSYPNNEDVDIESYDIDIEDTSSDGYDANQPCVINQNTKESKVNKCDVNIQIENSSYPNDEDVDIESYDINIENTSSDRYDANQPCVLNQDTKESKVNKGSRLERSRALYQRTNYIKPEQPSTLRKSNENPTKTYLEEVDEIVVRYIEQMKKLKRDRYKIIEEQTKEENRLRCEENCALLESSDARYDELKKYVDQFQSISVAKDTNKMSPLSYLVYEENNKNIKVEYGNSTEKLSRDNYATNKVVITKPNIKRYQPNNDVIEEIPKVTFKPVNKADEEQSNTKYRATNGKPQLTYLGFVRKMLKKTRKKQKKAGKR